VVTYTSSRLYWRMAVPASTSLRYTCAVSACASGLSSVHRYGGARTDVGEAGVNGGLDVRDGVVAVADAPGAEADARDARAVVERDRRPRHVEFCAGVGGGRGRDAGHACCALTRAGVDRRAGPKLLAEGAPCAPVLFVRHDDDGPSNYNV
jgi:hypothetical protein